MDVRILLWNQVHSGLQTSFLSLSSEIPGSVPLLQTQMLAALKTCNTHKIDLRGFWKCGWHSGWQDSPMLSEHWCAFCPCTLSCAGAGTEISAAKDINSHERKMVNFLGKHYFNFCAWKYRVWQTDKTSSSLNRRCELEADCPLLLFLAGEGAVTEQQTAASRDEFHQGWCQDLAKEWHVSCKTTSLIQKAVFKVQRTNCQRLLGHTAARYILCCTWGRWTCCSILVLLFGWGGNREAVSTA